MKEETAESGWKTEVSQCKNFFASKVSTILSSQKKFISSDFSYGRINMPDLKKKREKEDLISE